VGPAARFAFINALACDGHGHAYVADDVDLRIVDLATFAVTTIANVRPPQDYSEGGNGPGIAVGPDGVVYMPGEPGTIMQMVPGVTQPSILAGAVGVLAVRPGMLPAAVSAPTYMAVTATGDLVTVDSNESSVLRVRNAP
jgi:hypothetical protein